MTEKWINNHKVNCSNCLYVKNHYYFEDGLPFRISQTCFLKKETDYKIPFEEEWDCDDFVKWSMIKAIILKLKTVLK